MLCASVEANLITTSEIPSPNDREVERSNKELDIWMQQYIDKHQSDLDLFLQATLLFKTVKGISYHYRRHLVSFIAWSTWELSSKRSRLRRKLNELTFWKQNWGLLSSCFDPNSKWERTPKQQGSHKHGISIYASTSIWNSVLKTGFTGMSY